MKLSAFHQEHPHTCLPACIRIVLDYWGYRHTEVELANVCGTAPGWGTLPDEAVSGLEELGYGALWFENASVERLVGLTLEAWPVIVFLRAADIPHGRSGLHAIVISAVESDTIVAMDPALGKEIRLHRELFIQAWNALGNQGMVVWVTR